MFLASPLQQLLLLQSASLFPPPTHIRAVNRLTREHALTSLRRPCTPYSSRRVTALTYSLPLTIACRPTARRIRAAKSSANVEFVPFVAGLAKCVCGPSIDWLEKNEQRLSAKDPSHLPAPFRAVFATPQSPLHALLSPLILMISAPLQWRTVDQVRPAAGRLGRDGRQHVRLSSQRLLPLHKLHLRPFIGLSRERKKSFWGPDAIPIRRPHPPSS